VASILSRSHHQCRSRRLDVWSQKGATWKFTCYKAGIHTIMTEGGGGRCGLPRVVGTWLTMQLDTENMVLMPRTGMSACTDPSIHSTPVPWVFDHIVSSSMR
jgi:hypothetical protein